MRKSLASLVLSCWFAGCGAATKVDGPAAAQSPTPSAAENVRSRSTDQAVEPGARCVSYCDKVSECGTLDGARVSSCSSDCQESYQRAQAAGCSEQFDAVFECVDACNPADFSSECEALMSAFDQCLAD